MNLIEPQWWQDILLILNNIVFNSNTLQILIPILADIFVFSYPIILVVRYSKGIIQDNPELKSSAITVWCSAAYVTIINMIIQSIRHKDRPIFSEGNSVHLILNELPTAAFPSDHAAVSMVIWLVIALIAFKQRNQFLKSLSFILIVAAIIMSISRVAVWVHRPTDIIAGWTVACVVMWILHHHTINMRQQTYINQPLIRLQEWIFNHTWLTTLIARYSSKIPNSTIDPSL